MPKLGASFELTAPSPVDSRQTVSTYTDLTSEAFLKLAYEGLLAYVQDEGKVYIYKNGEWVELIPAPEVDEESETLIWK